MASAAGLDLAAEMAAIVGAERVLSGAAVRRVYDCDAYTVHRSAPGVVVQPSSTEQVAQVVRRCNALGVPFVARGAGTGLSGGAMPTRGGVIVSLKKMTQVLSFEPENRRMRAQAGAVNIHMTRLAEPHGLHFAPDPSSQTVATLGGNIAENSGGPHTLKYGVTGSHVLGLTLVDPSGEIVELGGDLEAMPGFDLMGVVIGSEGTLGIVTECSLKLTPIAPAVRTLRVTFGSVKAATETVSAIIAEGVIPAALEMMDRKILDVVRQTFGLDFHAETAAMLIVECDGEPEAVDDEIGRVLEVCHRQSVLEVKVAQNAEERALIWKSRKQGVGAMGRLAPSIVTHDGVIPRSKLPEVLDFVYATAAEHGVNVANLFHAGDGNLHPCFYFDDRDPAQVAAVVAAGEKIVARCVELGGSVTGEHGVGVEKKELLRLMFSPEALALQDDVRRVFNPGELCNPDKVLPDSRTSREHNRNWRPS